MHKNRLMTVVFSFAILCLLLVGCTTYADGLQGNYGDMYTAAEEGTDSPIASDDDTYALTIDDFYQSLYDFAEAHGLYGLHETIEISPDVVYLFSSLEEWQAHLEETWFSFVEDSARIFADINRFGYEPLHDLTVITFSETSPIVVYLELDEIELNGRKAHPIRMGNHDQVLLPVEPILDSIDISYVWDESTNLLHIEGLVYDLILEPGIAGLSPYQQDIPFRAIGADLPVLLESKASGLYMHSMLFSLMFVEIIHLDFPEWPTVEQPFIPLIYHDLYKVVLVTHERRHYLNYQNKRIAMEYQFDRAAFPLENDISFVIRGGSAFDDGVQTELTTRQPFTVFTKYYDFIMLPAVEVFELLGIDATWDESNSSAIVKIATWDDRDSEYHVRSGEPIFPTTDRDWAMAFHHDVVPMIVEDTLFISHSDLRRMLLLSGVSVYIDRYSSRLTISVWGSDW